MASTNKTINYNLSQYVANDKPTYLVDYNSDMNKIDTQMKANSDLAGLAKTEADDLSSRIDGQDVIIGNLNTTVGQHTNDISSLNTDVSDINTKVGDLTDLDTTDKSDIVNAINEVNTKIGDLTNLDTTDKSDIVNAINEVNSKDEYSTTEKVVGKWIDNKPVYRKVVTITSAIDLTTGTHTCNTGITNIETPVKFDMNYISGSAWQFAPKLSDDYNVNAYNFNLAGGNLTYYVGSALSVTKIVMVIEYTKTTD